MSDTEQGRLDAMADAAARRAVRETTQHLDGTLHVQSTASLSAGTWMALISIAVTISGSMIAVYVAGERIDASHEQRILALEKAEETRRQIATADRAELIGELRGLRRELQEAIERLDQKIERRAPARNNGG